MHISNNVNTVFCSRFNHKTGAEDVHFTAMSSNDESDTDVDGCNNDEGIVEEEALAQNSSIDMTVLNNGNCNVSDSDSSSVSDGDTSMLEMIMIKDVSSGTEVRIFLSVMLFS